jgi:hypothetical protein
MDEMKKMLDYWRELIAELEAGNDHDFDAGQIEAYRSCVSALESIAASQAAALADEDLWHNLLWMNHARYFPYPHMPYGDDGEMQCCGIDFKRWTAQQIDEHLSLRALHEASKRHLWTHRATGSIATSVTGSLGRVDQEATEGCL